VTHPFHPLFGREFRLVDYQHNWGEDRVYFTNDSGVTSWFPASWTDVGPLEPFVAISAGRAAFRVGDLLELAGLIATLQPKPAGKRRRSV
jgi:Family of unknown function (DUF5372)